MSLTALKALALAKKYTEDTIEGAGAVAGKPCQIQSITDIAGGKRVTFLWVDNSNVEHTSTMDVKDGEDGKGIKTVTVNANNHLVITYTDDTTYDAGEVKITAKVNSVNGKTGDVSLSTSDLNNDSDFVSDSNYVHTDNNYNNASKALVDGMTATLAQKADTDDVIDGASYDSTNHRILFTSGATTLFSLDAAAFVKDGMVDTVEISSGNLVITFNTDAGKQSISIPLTDIFDPSNYYNKTATDNLLADKADKTDVDSVIAGQQNLLKDTVGWTGKNLLKNTASTITKNGVTFTVNSDGSVTVDGTATANTSLYLAEINSSKFPTSIIVSNGVANDNAYIYANAMNGSSFVRQLGNTRKSKEFNLNLDYSDYEHANLEIWITNGITVSSLTFYPMIRYADIADDTWEPYHESVETIYEELTEEVKALPREVFVTTDTRTTTTNDANTLPCGFTRMNDENSNLPTDGTGGSVWYDILTVRQSNDPSNATWGYGFQLAVQTTTNTNMGDMYVRAVNGGATPTWSAWRKLN